MTKVFVLTEVGYEYNDETYDRSSGGTPIKIYTDKVTANSECDKLNHKRWNAEGRDGMSAYSWDDTEVMSQEEYEAYLKEHPFYEVFEVDMEK